MLNDILVRGELTLDQYVSEIFAKRVYHNMVPRELRNNIYIIHAEIAVGMRKFQQRGYDVVRNRFFIKQTVQVKDLSGNVHDKQDDVFFGEFEEYYVYLAGDIYNSACYYQYFFSKEEIAKYRIDLSKISNRAFVDDAFSKHAGRLENKKNGVDKQVEYKKEKLSNWKDKVCACDNYDEFRKTVQEFKNCKNTQLWFLLSAFAMFNKEKNIPIVVRYLQDTDDYFIRLLINMLCVQYGNESILECFDSRYWRRKSEIKTLIQDFSNGYLEEDYRKYYDTKTGFFCLEHHLVDKNATEYKRVKGEIIYYYDSFEAFADACNYDLSDAQLELAPIKVLNLSNFVINHRTRLPLSSIENPHYTFCKYYDLARDLFVVEEQWRATPTSTILSKKEYSFELFVDFVAFLEGDLTNADLLFCEGLSFITDFSHINLSGAVLTSYVKERAGLLEAEEIISIPSYGVLEATSATELSFVQLEESSCINTEETLRKELDYGKASQHNVVYYISDLHLPQHFHPDDIKTTEDIVARIKRIAVEVAGELNSQDVLLIAGDTSCDLQYFKTFVKLLRESTAAHVIFVLGNHELWGFKQVDFDDIVSTYRDILEEDGMYLLQNNLIYSETREDGLKVIPEEELALIEKATLRTKLARASLVLFGGLGFAGLNNHFNANSFIYQQVISRDKEISESEKFEKLYIKIRNFLPDREVIIASHMPLCDWSHDIEPHGGYVYVNGHTHENKYQDDGIRRLYADNQVGYYRKLFHAKHFYIQGNFDPFVDYSDGIYEITRRQYADFYRGKNIKMDFERHFDCLYMLKRNGYYCFIIRTDKGKLSILNGGSTKVIKNKSIESCYEAMPEIIELIKSPLDNYMEIQKSIAKLVSAIGGEGRIHGAIVDIDYFNHIYINPSNLAISGYYATSMVDKLFYRTIEGLLKEHRPELLISYHQYLARDSSTSLILKQDENMLSTSERVYSTDMYKISNILKKMQKLSNNILTVWPVKPISSKKIKPSGASE